MSFMPYIILHVFITSLMDDGSRSLSKGLSADQINKKIALDFIDDLKQRKKLDCVSEDKQDSNDKVTFNRPVKTEHVDILSKTALFGAVHGGKARVMNTFEFGRKPAKVKAQVHLSSIVTESSCNSITLDFKTEEKDEVLDEVENTINDVSTKIFVPRKREKKRFMRKRNIADEDE